MESSTETQYEDLDLDCLNLAELASSLPPGFESQTTGAGNHFFVRHPAKDTLLAIGTQGKTLLVMTEVMDRNLVNPSEHDQYQRLGSRTLYSPGPEEVFGALFEWRDGVATAMAHDDESDGSCFYLTRIAATCPKCFDFLAIVVDGCGFPVRMGPDPEPQTICYQCYEASASCFAPEFQGFLGPDAP